MCELKNHNSVAETEDKYYFVDFDESGLNRCFGVAVALKSNTEASACVKNLFFTRDEAEKCCLWLAENDVEPIIFCEVLSNFYQI